MERRELEAQSASIPGKGHGVVLAMVMLAQACTPVAEPVSSAGVGWKGTITTDDEHTHVVNESGSVWGGAARLEEVLSIGLDSGPREYLFSRISSVAADDDHVYVLDTRPPVLRVYGMDGRHVRDIGGRGQGPGEFQRPTSVVIGPGGRVIVRDDRNARLSFFEPTGELAESWPLSGGFSTLQELVVGSVGELYTPVVTGRHESTGEPTWGFARLNSHGEIAEMLSPPVGELHAPRVTGREGWAPIPFYPQTRSSLMPTGGWATGTGETYRFEIHHPDGRRLTVDRLGVEAVAVSPEERLSKENTLTARRRLDEPLWTWNGPPVPATKPFFFRLDYDSEGRVWVSTWRESVLADPCSENSALEAASASCWKERTGMDVFGPDGRYLGEVIFPADVNADLSVSFIRSDTLIMRVVNATGIQVVKVYRLIFPFQQ